MISKSVISVVLRTPWSASTSNYIRKLHWLRVAERIDYKIAVLTYNVLRMGQPRYLFDYISVRNPVCSLRFSSRFLLNVPFCSLKAALPAYCHSAPTVWNMLRNRPRLTFLSVDLRLNYFLVLFSLVALFSCL